MRTRWASGSVRAAGALAALGGTTAHASGAGASPYYVGLSVSDFIALVLLVLEVLAVYSFLGALLVKLVTAWVCGKTVSYRQAYVVLFVAGAQASIQLMGAVWWVESVGERFPPMQGPMTALAVLMSVAPCPVIFGRLIDTRTATPLGVRRGLPVSLIVGVLSAVILAILILPFFSD